MKRSIFYLISLFSFLLCSCHDDNSDSAEDNFVEVSFQLGGEMTDESAFSSTADVEKPDLYGIDIAHADGTPYAYGLFDDLGLAKLKLLKGEKYTFRIMAVPDGKALCFDHNYGNYGGLFYRYVDYAPCMGETCPLTNEFIYHQELHFTSFDKPYMSFYYKIYSGYLPNYLAGNDNVIHMNMRRMYGTVSLASEDLKTGKLEFQIMYNDTWPHEDFVGPFDSSTYILTPEKSNTEFVYSMRFWKYLPEWMPDDYSFTTTYVVRWIDDNGHTTNLGNNYYVKIQRNKETKVVLNLSELLKK